MHRGCPPVELLRVGELALALQERAAVARGSSVIWRPSPRERLHDTCAPRSSGSTQASMPWSFRGVPRSLTNTGVFRGFLPRLCSPASAPRRSDGSALTNRLVLRERAEVVRAHERVRVLFAVRTLARPERPSVNSSAPARSLGPCRSVPQCSQGAALHRHTSRAAQMSGRRSAPAATEDQEGRELSAGLEMRLVAEELRPPPRIRKARAQATGERTRAGSSLVEPRRLFTRWDHAASLLLLPPLGDEVVVVAHTLGGSFVAVDTSALGVGRHDLRDLGDEGVLGVSRCDLCNLGDAHIAAHGWQVEGTFEGLSKPEVPQVPPQISPS